MKVRLLNGGGTIVQAQSGDGQKMRWSIEPSAMVADLGLSVEVDAETVHSGLSANYSLRTIVNISRDLKAADSTFAGTVITVGTDVLEEIAFAIEYLGPYPRPVVFVAAMRPSTALSFDGPVNLFNAIKILTEGALRGGDVVATISDKIHQGSRIVKVRSERIDAFESSPGHIGEVRNGVPVIDYLPNSYIHTHPVGVEKVSAGFSVPRVGLITAHVDQCLEILNLDTLDGLVVAGMGTGSVPDNLKDLLAEWSGRFPIVVSTRCPFGLGYNDWLYKGGVQKYEDLGFVLRDFSGLSSLKARMKLSIDLMISAAQGSTLTYPLSSE